MLHTEADFVRMRTKVAAGAQPWASGYNALTSNGRAQINATPRPLANVIRGGDGANFAQFYIDVARSYQLALRWRISLDRRFADQAVLYLNAWSSTLTALTGNSDRFLAAGIYGYEFANAAELMRDYDGWASQDFARFQQMMVDIFYPMNKSFLRNHNDAEITNYWANWDLCNIASMLAIGVLSDRADIYDEAMTYYKAGQGNGAGLQNVYHVHPGYLGQWQESGRDQGHTTLGIGLAACICEMAWSQGDDLYGYENNRFLSGAEYVAKSNLKDSSGAFWAVPWFVSSNKQGVQAGLSPAGQGHQRFVWEMVSNHYANRRGVAAPWSSQMAASLRPEWDGGNGDQLGFGTIAFTRDAPTILVKPSGLSARVRGPAVVLSWWGSEGAESYALQRSAQADAGFSTIASYATSDVLTFADTDVSEGQVWHYRVVAASGSATAVSDVARAAIKPELLYSLPNPQIGQSIDSRVIPRLSDFTISVKVYVNTIATWARVFDFGSGPRRWMMMTVRSNTGKLRYAISTVHGYNAQIVEGPVPPTKRWVHLAVTLRGNEATLYVDGAAVGTNTAMTLTPGDLGEVTQAWIARSQYAADAALDGELKGLQIYQGAIPASGIAALASAVL
ncbi:LamG-like jellyroll fold domain-containing protein [Niveibacterium sp. SC-1]|uniref:LamG-like jellyroll fold domain-containing protein n=1 Tax=Niveibacterium sp. SC-1 TaxID=3135646 RepID=UPI00311E85B5